MNAPIITFLKKALLCDDVAIIITDVIRLKSILKDLCPGLNKEINIVIAFQINHLAEELYSQAGDISELIFLKFTDRFGSATGYERKTAEWCVLIWCYALNKNLTFSYKSVKYPSPSIEKFDVSAAEVVVGNKVLVSWKVENSTKVLLYYQEKEYEVREHDYINFVISQDETISIVVQGFFGYLITDRKEVKAINRVRILKFEPESNKVIAGSPVRLRWSVENAKSISLSHTGTTFKANDETIVFPIVSTTYTLTATNNAGSETSVTGIKVIPIRSLNENLLLKIPRLRGFVFKQKREVAIFTISHKAAKLKLLKKKVKYSVFDKTRRQFFTGFLHSIKDRIKSGLRLKYPL